MDKNIIVLKYHNNFAENLSNYAYGKILEKNSNCCCVYENDPDKRNNFEFLMNDFNLECNYLSKTRTDELARKSGYMDYSEINSKRIKKSRVADINLIMPSEADKITDDIKCLFNFQNREFIVNHDILEDIFSHNSIGLYISKDDLPDVKFINAAIKRLNKYIKQPKLYIFSEHIFEIDDSICARFLNLSDWREEFYFLQNCKHKIIHGINESYSVGFWASILSNKPFYYVVHSKKLRPSKKFINWIAI